MFSWNCLGSVDKNLLTLLMVNLIPIVTPARVVSTTPAEGRVTELPTSIQFTFSKGLFPFSPLNIDGNTNCSASMFALSSDSFRTCVPGTLTFNANNRNTIAFSLNPNNLSNNAIYQYRFNGILDRNQNQTTSTSSTGFIFSSATGSGSTPIVTISAAYSIAPNWMDYIRRNMSSPSSIAQSSPVTCDGTETGWYNSCIHGGEILKIPMTNLTNCTGVTATDSLGAFNWVCAVQSGSVFIYSVGLKNEKNLSDLIDFTGATWLNNSVTIQQSGTTIATTTPAQWWTNPIVVQNTPTTLSTSGTINIINSTTPAGQYHIGASKVALVVKPGITVDSAGPTSALTFDVSNTPFGWIEGQYMNSTDNLVIDNLTDAGNFTQFRNLRVVKSVGTTALISLGSSSDSGMYFHNVKSYTEVAGINPFPLGSSRSMINGLNSYGGNNAISLNAPNAILLKAILSGNNSAGINSSGSGTNPFLGNTTLMNSLNFGIASNNPRFTFSNLLIGNIRVNGTNIGAPASNYIFINSIFANTGTN